MHWREQPGCRALQNRSVPGSYPDNVSDIRPQLQGNPEAAVVPKSSSPMPTGSRRDGQGQTSLCLGDESPCVATVWDGYNGL